MAEATEAIAEEDVRPTEGQSSSPKRPKVRENGDDDPLPDAAEQPPQAPEIPPPAPTIDIDYEKLMPFAMMKPGLQHILSNLSGVSIGRRWRQRWRC